jgi:alkaline phosphatase
MSRHHIHRSMARCALLALLATTVFQQSASAAKNVILMIADGSGHNTWLATSMNQGRVGQQAYDQSGWQRFACSTYPLNLSHKPTGNLQQDEVLVYDPAKAWDVQRTKFGLGDFAGYAWLTSTPTDSAAAATALASGQKTYNNAINWTNDNRPMRGQTIAEIAKAQGKSAGVITTVEWSDATPAGLGGAHNINRSNHAEIANEMLDTGCLSVIMGGGNPDYDNDGQPLAAGAKRDYQWVGGPDTWQSLKSGQSPWKLIEKKADFEALAAGPTPPKLLGVPQVAKTLQEKRSFHRTSSRGAEARPGDPFADERVRNVPSLAVMTKAAIHCLENNPKGFYLMIEGGAVDWANHANEPDRMIEEQSDYLKAVETVVAWVEKHGGWNDTLLILTADHETGLIWGPDSAKVAFQSIIDHGTGRMPGFKHNSHGHSNSLVPLYACGPGSQRFDALVKGTDLKAGEVWQFSGRFVDNTDVFRVMQAEVTAAAEAGAKDQ